MFDADDVIFSYTRSDAINDGVFVSISQLHPDLCAGLPTDLNVAVTAEVWALIPEHKSREAVRYFLRQSHKNILKRYSGHEWLFRYFNGDSVHILKAVVHLGDSRSEHCITIMLPNQD